MCDWERGIIKVSDFLCVHPGYTFEDFKKTKYYNNQDGIRQIILDEVFRIEDYQYKVSLIFIKYKLYSLSLSCFDIDLSWDFARKRKELHDEVLKKKGITETNFNWGKIISSYDLKGGFSSIDFYYL